MAGTEWIRGEIIIHLRGQAPEGCLAAPDTARMRGEDGAN
jgi:hypothetical protein